MEQAPIRAVGLVWYTLENYTQVKAIMEDGDRLPGTYSQWRLKAEQAERQLRRQGNLVVRAHLDPDTFREFCRANGQNLNAQGRTQFASWVAAKEHGNTH